MTTEQNAERLDDSTSKDSAWWQPTPLKLFFRLLLAGVVITLIISLEILLYFSQRDQGLGDILSDDWLHYTWTLVPASIPVSLSLYFSAFDFNFKVLAAYYKLRRTADFQQAMSVNFLKQMAGSAFLTSLKSHHPGISLTTIISILGKFLTIVAGGLFNPTSVSRELNVIPEQSTWFNKSIGPNLGYFGNGMSVAGLVIYNNFSTPTWTYGDSVFSSITLARNDSGRYDLESKHSSRMRATVPAIRSSSQYTLSPDINSFCTNVTGPWTDGFSNKLAFSMIGYSSLNCSLEYNTGTVTVSENKYFGLFLGYGSVSGAGVTYDQFGGNRVGGPPNDWSYVWGKFNDRNLSHISGLKCNESIHELQANVTSILPTFDVDITAPPISNEESVRRPDIPVLQNRPDSLANVGIPQTSDYTFQAVVYGKNGVALEHLGSSARNEQVTQAIQNLAGLYRAIQYSTDARINVTGQEATYDAVLNNPKNVRLIQNAASRHVLVGLLAIILLCLALASILMDIRYFVSYKPCTIAAVSSFLADSNIVNSYRIILEGSGWLSDKEMQQQGIMQNCMFGLVYPGS
ncbi:hypothetical protein AOQ84DRAFT_228027 [Glonium stellatum]|uniref:Uncharacterized protein n=1 Tax=Glonium stellatum TaxID=574774 RepID=A0A8E2ER44_9PEZI|nr:hypothetical protein AOQ84DRAFT_228027 [Glonium stellatum]